MNNKQRYFQWVVGERRGEILAFEKIEEDGGEIYIKFKDNSRINEKLVAQINQKDLSGKMMAEIDSPGNCWQFKEVEEQQKGPRYEKDAKSGTKFEVPSADEIARADLSDGGGKTRPEKEIKRKKIKLIPPRPTPPTHSVFGQISNITPEPVQSTQEPKSTTISNIDVNDPVYILMSKAKKHDIDINMEMTVSLPPRTLYLIAKDSFDEGDDKFIDYIVDEITVNEIKDALKEAIKNMYEDNPPSNEHKKEILPDVKKESQITEK